MFERGRCTGERPESRFVIAVSPPSGRIGTLRATRPGDPERVPAGPLGLATGVAVLVAGVAFARGPGDLMVLLALVGLLVPVLVTRRDAVSLLSLAVFALFAVPAYYRVGPLGALPLPAGLLCLVAWFLYRTSRAGIADPGRQPVRTATLTLLWLFTLSYSIVYSRFASSLELSSANRRLMTVFALAGFALLAADGIRDRGRLDTLLRRIVLAATFTAAIGGVQYLFGRDYSDIFVLPGMSQGAESVVIGDRSFLRRVAGTADHAIEFGVVLAAALPLALHFALLARGRAERWWAWGQVAVIGVVVPMSLSRSAVISFLAGFLTLTAVWTGRRRLNGLVILVVSLVFMRAAFPGLLGTIKSLFLWAGQDPSITGRLDDYVDVEALIGERPFLGRGLGTFVPTEYFFLDNQMLGLLLETGLVGTAALLVWIAVGLSVARGARRRGLRQQDRELGQALAAGMLAIFVSFFTFDTLSFLMCAGMLFLLIGCAGALWRMTASPDALAVPAGPGRPAARR